MKTKNICLAVVGLLAISSPIVRAAFLTENFDTGLPTRQDGAAASGEFINLASGSWYSVNHSTVIGETTGVIDGQNNFGPYNGADNSQAIFINSLADGDNTINAWLISPQLSFLQGDTLSFYTRTVTGPLYPDRLEVRFSDSGASVDTGVSDVSVGDFDVLLGTVNPGLTVGGYPDTFTLFSYVIPTTASGRIAFRYFVTNGGPLGANSDMIGIDAVSIIPEPATASLLAAFGVLGFAACRRRRA